MTNKVYSILLLLLLSLTVTLAILHGVGVVEESAAIVGPGHAAELYPLQLVLQRLGTLHTQEADLNPV